MGTKLRFHGIQKLGFNYWGEIQPIKTMVTQWDSGFSMGFNHEQQGLNGIYRGFIRIYTVTGLPLVMGD